MHMYHKLKLESIVINIRCIPWGENLIDFGLILIIVFFATCICTKKESGMLAFYQTDMAFWHKFLQSICSA